MSRPQSRKTKKIIESAKKKTKAQNNSEENKKELVTKFNCNSNITNVLFEMISNKHEPNINVIIGGVTELQFKIDGITCAVQEHLDLTCPDDILHEVSDN